MLCIAEPPHPRSRVLLARTRLTDPRRIRMCELSMPMAFTPLEKIAVRLAALPELCRAAMPAGVDAAMP